MKTIIELTDVSNLDLTEYSRRAELSNHSNLATAWKRIWDTLATQLIGHSEPIVRQVRDRAGSLIWHVHDPETGYSGCFSSEQEVRAWLERRYYF
jgi:hypothetical protein